MNRSIRYILSLEAAFVALTALLFFSGAKTFWCDLGLSAALFTGNLIFIYLLAGILLSIGSAGHRLLLLAFLVKTLGLFALAYAGVRIFLIDPLAILLGVLVSLGAVNFVFLFKTKEAI